MSAASKKKQDEKNTKIVRELVSLAGNKHCFDCNQRGPTYVNMTIGSFVCTGCSGILSVTARERRSQLAEFKYKTDRLDVMLASLLDCQSSSNLLLVVKMVLTTFHANAAVERGFSVNKECMEPNLQELSIWSLRIVYDSLKSKPAAEGLKEVPEEMLKYVRSARKKYRNVLERQRAEDDHWRYEASKKRKAERTAELQSKRKKLLADASVLTKDADSLVYKCEETSDMSLIVKSNALRRAAKQKLDKADQVQKDIVSLNSTLPI